MDLLRGDFEFLEEPPALENNADLHEIFTEFEGTGGCGESASMPGTVSPKFFEGVIPTHLLMVSLLEHICTLYEVNEDRSNHLFHVLCQQLVKMKLMPSFTVMSDFKAIRKKYQRALVDWLSIAVNGMDPQTTFSKSLYTERRISLQTASISNPTTKQKNSPVSTSRYWDEYEQVGEVGKGGFGSVYKVRNNLDGRLYAVKKVQLAEESYEECLKVLREVKVLAKLTHQNIVRYHSAWLEYSTRDKFSMSTKKEEPNIKDIDFSSTSNSSSDTSSISFRESTKNTKSSNHRLFTANTGDSELYSAASVNMMSQSRAEEISRRRSRMTCHLRQDHICKELVPVCAGTFSMSRPFLNRSRGILGNLGNERYNMMRSHALSTLGLKEFGMMMYIQMELCSATLKDWLLDRNACICVDESVNWQRNVNIFKQLLEGVKYIHSSGLIHRDLKPRNVFINHKQGKRDVEVKIGDFGLARDASWGQDTRRPLDVRSLLEPPFMHSEDSSIGTNPTSGVGTCTYAAPEQLRDSNYSYKADIFSLGIILFELFSPFKTEMERVLAIKALRKGYVAEEVMNEWPVEGELIKSMLSHDPFQRPSADAILLKSLFHDKDTVITMLRRELAKRDSQIDKLKEELLAERLKNSSKR